MAALQRDRVVDASGSISPAPGGCRLFNLVDPPTATMQRDFLRVLCWNIERGYPHRLPAVLAELKAADADIILLQEVDVGNERTDRVDVGLVLAKALNMNYLFGTEFVELRSPLRSAKLQGGGVHGNAILSRYEILEPKSGLFRAQPASWENHKEQPRKGGRMWVSAVISTPLGDILAYSAHLEINCGIVGRAQQFLELEEDARLNRYKASCQVIAGDFNTVSHGLGRFVPHMISSWSDLSMRLWTIGTSEPNWWQKNFFSRHKDGDVVVFDDYGKPVIVPDCSRFQDPFHKDNDVTVGSYANVYSAKCDWVLLQAADILNKQVGDWRLLGRGGEDGLSDHLYLMVDFAPHAQLMPILLRSRLIGDDYAFAIKIVEKASVLSSAESDRLCTLILNALGTDQAIMFLKHCIVREISLSESEGTFFRGNSVATKLMTAFAKDEGHGYLRTIIVPFLDQIAEEQIDVKLLSLDPPTELSLEHRKRFLTQFQFLFDRILASTDLVPWQIRAAITKFGSASNVARVCVGGYFFLRFFCPALTLPHAHELTKESPDGATMRVLIMLAKVLQNMSNRVEFGVKETGLNFINEAMRKNSDALSKFLNEICRTKDSVYLLDGVFSGASRVKQNSSARELSERLHAVLPSLLNDVGDEDDDQYDGDYGENGHDSDESQ